MTIVDVAKEAGVSTATVSAVLNKRPHLRPSTRLKVLEAVEKLGYIPSQTARDLVKQDSKRFGGRITGNIGIVYLKATPGDSFSDNPFYYAVFEGISAETESVNEGLLFSSVEILHDSMSLPKMIRDHQVDGLILIGNIEGNGPAIHALSKTFPLILVSRYVKGEDFDCVVADNMGGARKAVRHLIEMGYEEIGFISPPLSNTCYYERYHGFKAALEELGLGYREDLVEIGDTEGDSWIRSYLARVRSRSSSPALGVFAANDVVAMKAIKEAREAGLEMPRDLGLIGFDDLPLGTHTTPTLTTMRVPKVTMGKMAVQKLLERVRKGAPSVGRILLSVELVERESSRRLAPSGGMPSATVAGATEPGGKGVPRDGAG